MDAHTYALLEKWASDDFRSVNGQLEMLIDKALRDAGRKKESSVPPLKNKNKK